MSQLTGKDVEGAKCSLQGLYDEGYRSIAVCLMHSYTFQDHEQMIGKLAEEIGLSHVSLSAELSPMIKIVPRGNSSTADAYLTPEIKRYIAGFEDGFEDLRTCGCRCEFMQSDGGLVEFSNLSGLRAILSGPAGGVVGYARTSYDDNDKTPVIGFDMGGTSTDCSRYVDANMSCPVLSPRLILITYLAWFHSLLTEPLDTPVNSSTSLRPRQPVSQSKVLSLTSIP